MNNINDRAKWSATDRAWRLASQNFQLLSMLEVLEGRTAADNAHLVLAARLTLAFPAQVSLAEREMPIDPAGRSRGVLRAAAEKARLLHRMALRIGRKQAVISVELTLIAKSLRELADACENLGHWIAAHDEAFENPDPTRPMPLEAA